MSVMDAPLHPGTGPVAGVPAAARPTRHQVDVLVLYANDFVRAIRAGAGENALSEHTIAVRSLASRLARWVTYGEGAFARDDVELLGEVGTALVRHAETLAGEPAARMDARRRMQAGRDVLALRGALAEVAG